MDASDVGADLKEVLIPADRVLIAFGFRPSPQPWFAGHGIETDERGRVKAPANGQYKYQTTNAKVFAGGDMVPGERTVTTAVGMGKRAARHIDGWLRGQPYRDAAKAPLVSFDMLHLPVFSDVAPAAQRTLAVAERISGFEEVVAGLGQPEARREAERCLSCGNCFECDNCWAACPESAIVKLGPGRRYRYDYAKCTGCAACFEQCPCHAIEMVEEPS